MNMRFSWRYAIRSLRRGGQSSIFAVASIAVGVMVIVALQLVGIMANAFLTGDIRALNGGDLAVHTELASITDAQLGYFTQLQSQEAITAYSPVADGESTTTTSDGLQRVTFFAVDPTTFPLAGSIPVISPSGKSLSTLLQGQSAVLTDTQMQQLHAHVGDTLALTTDSGGSGRVTITGEIASAGVINARASMLISLQSYAQFTNPTGVPLGYTWVFINVPGHSDAKAAALATQIKQHFPLLNTITVPQTQQQIQSEIDGIRTVLRIIGLLALLIGGVGIINTMQVLLRRRLLEIAMLKTLGYHQRNLLLMFGIESLLLGLVGGVSGALLGIGVSFAVKALVERAFLFTLPTIIDISTVLSGMGIGIATTLIFGLLPIVQTSAVRPIVVLRSQGSESANADRAISVGLLLLLTILFGLLALSILGNLAITFLVVFGTSIVLGLLTVGFTVVGWLMSHWPIPDRRHLSALPALLVIIILALLLLRLSTGFGALLLALAAISVIAAFLPQSAQAEIRLAMRNIRRARIRSAMTMVALFAGVFSIGLGLVLSQNLKDYIASRSSTVNLDNAYIIASAQDAPLVSTQLANMANVSNEQISYAAPDHIIAINGNPVQSTSTQGLTGNLSGVNGFQLAQGNLPNVTLELGVQDTRMGRLLTSSDAGTNNAVFPINESESPANLKLGDLVSVSSLDGKTMLTLHIVGFYSGIGTFGSLAAVLADQRVAATLGQDNAFTIFAVQLPTSAQEQDLQQIKRAVPTAITLGIAATINQINTILDNVVQAVESIAALAMFAGLVLIANTTALSMLERQRELGILKAIGHTNTGVLGMVLVENGILGVSGSYIALILVSIAATILNQLTFHTNNAAGASVALTLAIAGATVALCMLVAGAVSWRATQVRPIEVLRYE